jgi:ABC-type Na+ transport system ATPase subunit NatA
MDEVHLLADDLGIMHKGRMLYAGAYDAFEANMQAPTLEDEFIRLVEDAPERPAEAVAA